MDAKGGELPLANPHQSPKAGTYHPTWQAFRLMNGSNPGKANIGHDTYGMPGSRDEAENLARSDESAALEPAA